nr:MAG TPA: hypothetical protein [Caudoviricetes sp.]DAN64558.1 MAG TPA: hypothetical protein [Caudoviricetes sp.]
MTIYFAYLLPCSCYLITANTYFFPLDRVAWIGRYAIIVDSRVL